MNLVGAKRPWLDREQAGGLKPRSVCINKPYAPLRAVSALADIAVADVGGVAAPLAAAEQPDVSEAGAIRQSSAAAASSAALGAICLAAAPSTFSAARARTTSARTAHSQRGPCAATVASVTRRAPPATARRRGAISSATSRLRICQRRARAGEAGRKMLGRQSTAAGSM